MLHITKYNDFIYTIPTSDLIVSKETNKIIIEFLVTVKEK